jgi:hypothetical protein
MSTPIEPGYSVVCLRAAITNLDRLVGAALLAAENVSTEEREHIIEIGQELRCNLDGALNEHPDRDSEVSS